MLALPNSPFALWHMFSVWHAYGWGFITKASVKVLYIQPLFCEKPWGGGQNLVIAAAVHSFGPKSIPFFLLFGLRNQ